MPKPVKSLKRVRPDWEKCIMDASRRGYSLCDRKIGDEFTFVGPVHAASALASGSRMTVCPECWAKSPK